MDSAPEQGIEMLQIDKKKTTLKTPKGTKDFGPEEMALRERLFSIITTVFKRHGAVTIDTPVFELKEVLLGKYGEEGAKLIYDLQDQGGELCSLRYDLTVPFARYLAMNRSIGHMKRYHVAKVYRRDQPALAKGRYREFYQCDFDIAGGGLMPLLPDAEVLKVVAEILTAVDIGSFVIKINSRLVLDGLFAVCGVDATLFRAACSSIDKLDKLPWVEVCAELVAKGVSASSAEQIGTFVRQKGGTELIEELLKSSELRHNETAKQGLEELRTLFGFLRTFEIENLVSFDLSLARGLDYYTGLILEAVLLEGSGVECGSVAGGGRYDRLVGMFSASDIPCVGASIGIERLFSVLSKKQEKQSTTTQVYVIATRMEIIDERLCLLNELWTAGINADTSHKAGKTRLLDQFSYCEKIGIPYAIIMGPEEIESSVYKVRSILHRTETAVPKADIVAYIKSLI